MTLSVVTSRDFGMVSPIALATLRLITCLRWAGLLDWHPQALHRSCPTTSAAGYADKILMSGP